MLYLKNTLFIALFLLGKCITPDVICQDTLRKPSFNILADGSWKALGANIFFPLSGNAGFESQKFRANIIGYSFDLINWDYEDHRSGISFTPYLVGLNLNDLQPGSENSPLDIGVLYLGYSRRSNRSGDGSHSGWLPSPGFQIGYYLTLLGNTLDVKTVYQQGISMSVTFDWSKYKSGTSTVHKKWHKGIGLGLCAAALPIGMILHHTANPYRANPNVPALLSSGVLVFSGTLIAFKNK